MAFPPTHLFLPVWLISGSLAPQAPLSCCVFTPDTHGQPPLSWPLIPDRLLWVCHWCSVSGRMPQTLSGSVSSVCWSPHFPAREHSRGCVLYRWVVELHPVTFYLWPQDTLVSLWTCFFIGWFVGSFCSFIHSILLNKRNRSHSTMGLTLRVCLGISYFYSPPPQPHG